MSSLEKTELQLGYIPLLDCVALLWAKQRGFFDEEGLNVPDQRSFLGKFT
jgi:NitT/TauT family transport system ATP-binding protein